MKSQGLVSEERHVLQWHLTDLAIQTVPIIHVPQMLLLEMLRQVSRPAKGFNKLLV
jgi:hypothetical protein